MTCANALMKNKFLSSDHMLPPQPSRVGADDYYKGSDEINIGLNNTQKHTDRERLTPDAGGIVLILVGLPARGKSFISRKLERFLGWKGLKTRMFNVGKYRREAVAPEESGRSSFFDAGNAAAFAAREAAASAALADALAFLAEGGKIAILDATNSTMARRRHMVEQVRAHALPFSVGFLETIANDPEILEANMMSKIKNSPDFWHLRQEDALADLKLRVRKYEDVYETVQDEEGPYIKLYDLSSKVMANNCYGRIAKSILPFMMAIHIGSRPIWLVRAGAGQENPQSPGSDRLSKLSRAGMSFAQALSEFVKKGSDKFWQERGKAWEPTHVITSTMPRAAASVSCFSDLGQSGDTLEQTSALNPIDKGAVGAGWWDVECPGDVPPWGDLEGRHPEFFAEWRRDPFRTRFPGGESYMDVMKRLESLLVDVEMSTRPVLIVSHLTVLQLLVAYFRGMSVEDAWQLEIPKNAVVEVCPTSGGGFAHQHHTLALDAPELVKLQSSDAKRGHSSQDVGNLAEVSTDSSEDCLDIMSRKRLRLSA